MNYQDDLSTIKRKGPLWFAMVQAWVQEAAKPVLQKIWRNTYHCHFKFYGIKRHRPKKMQHSGSYCRVVESSNFNASAVK